MSKGARSSGESGKLGRSSIEAYAGIGIGIVLAVQPMTWWLRVALFAILVFVCGDFCWRSPFTYKWNVIVKGGLCVAIAAWLGYVGWGNIRAAYQDDLFPKDMEYLKSWGPENMSFRVVAGESRPFYTAVPASRIVVFGLRLTRFSKKFKLMGVCFFSDPYKDPADVPNVSKSSLFDIDGDDLTIRIPWNGSYVDALEKNARGTDYFLLLVPGSFTDLNFSTLREAQESGAIELEWHGGPP
jgi:hypothetical protein